jgi:putative ABC transport system ATP-binding protein
MTMDSLITISGITKHYQTPGGVDVPVLHGIDLSIRRGEFVAIMGQSGSGKSTLMNILGCLDTPTTGNYELTGRNVSKLRDRQLAEVRNQTIGFVFQGFNLLKRMTALDNVALPLAYAGIGKREARQRARAKLEQTGLAELAHRLPNQLSGGQQQRVAIARALVMAPSLVLADEPTGNLDSTSGDTVMRMLSELHESGSTICLATHNPRYIALASRHIYLFDGRVVDQPPQ